MPDGSGQVAGGDGAAAVAARRAVMATCAEARGGELDAALAALGRVEGATDLRPPETGLVMLRGRMDGEGRRFNLGEATATRAAVRLPTGETGHAYHLGRDGPRARAAALLDALWQRRPREVEAALAPVAARLEAERALAARRTAATRVDFFTMVRGEDAR